MQQAQIDQLANLPLPTRLQAMEVLWESFTKSAADVVPAWHQEVLSQRLARLDAGLEKVIPWAKAKQNLRQMTGMQAT
jgi:Putative addiction module component